MGLGKYFVRFIQIIDIKKNTFVLMETSDKSSPLQRRNPRLVIVLRFDHPSLVALRNILSFYSSLNSCPTSVITDDPSNPRAYIFRLP